MFHTTIDGKDVGYVYMVTHTGKQVPIVFQKRNTLGICSRRETAKAIVTEVGAKDGSFFKLVLPKTRDREEAARVMEVYLESIRKEGVKRGRT